MRWAEVSVQTIVLRDPKTAKMTTTGNFDPEQPFPNAVMAYQRQTEAISISEEYVSASSDSRGDLTILFSSFGLGGLYPGSWGQGLRPAPRLRAPDASRFQSQDHPTHSEIHDIVRAMAEIARVGEAALAIIQVPPHIAVWVIAFVKWCLGREPSIRLLKGDSHQENVIVLQQPKSRIWVEVCTPSTRTFKVRTFKNVNHVRELLWESTQAVLLRPQKWSGMVQVQHYLRLHLQKI